MSEITGSREYTHYMSIHHVERISDYDMHLIDHAARILIINGPEYTVNVMVCNSLLHFRMSKWVMISSVVSMHNASLLYSTTCFSR